MASRLTKQFYRRCLNSIQSLSQTGTTKAVPALNSEELRSRSSYYKSWAKENIYQHSDALGPKEQVRLVSIGEEKRLWLLNKYAITDSLPPFTALAEARKKYEKDRSPSEAREWSPLDEP